MEFKNYEFISLDYGAEPEIDKYNTEPDCNIRIEPRLSLHEIRVEQADQEPIPVAVIQACLSELEN